MEQYLEGIGHLFPVLFGYVVNKKPSFVMFKE